jgi:hypothetical protein
LAILRSRRLNHSVASCSLRRAAWRNCETCLAVWEVQFSHQISFVTGRAIMQEVNRSGRN